MQWFRSAPPGDPFAVAMTSVKLGDRLLVVGCSRPKIVAQLAVKTGLTGRACVVGEDLGGVARAADAAQREGALLETETAPHTTLPYEDGAFDVVVINHVLGPAAEERRISILREALRVLRTGGRAVGIESAARSGLAALFHRAGTDAAEIERAFTSAGYRAVRTLAERQGLVFTEGAKRH